MGRPNNNTLDNSVSGDSKISTLAGIDAAFNTRYGGKTYVSLSATDQYHIDNLYDEYALEQAAKLNDAAQSTPDIQTEVGDDVPESL